MGEKEEDYSRWDASRSSLVVARWKRSHQGIYRSLHVAARIRTDSVGDSDAQGPPLTQPLHAACQVVRSRDRVLLDTAPAVNAEVASRLRTYSGRFFLRLLQQLELELRQTLMLAHLLHVHAVGLGI